MHNAPQPLSNSDMAVFEPDRQSFTLTAHTDAPIEFFGADELHETSCFMIEHIIATPVVNTSQPKPVNINISQNKNTAFEPENTNAPIVAATVPNRSLGDDAVFDPVNTHTPVAAATIPNSSFDDDAIFEPVHIHTTVAAATVPNSSFDDDAIFEPVNTHTSVAATTVPNSSFDDDAIFEPVNTNTTVAAATVPNSSFDDSDDIDQILNAERVEREYKLKNLAGNLITVLLLLGIAAGACYYFYMQ